MRKSEMGIILATVAVIALAAMYRVGFREGQLKASLGIRYYFFDANGDAVHDPTLSLRRTR